jgi:hypothetical protein
MASGQHSNPVLAEIGHSLDRIRPFNEKPGGDRRADRKYI